MCSLKNTTMIMSYCITILILLINSMASVSSQPLSFGFYRRSCPSAEHIVRQTVRNALSVNPGLGAGLIRMYFHDCFVRGCDASVLLKSTGGRKAERDHPANFPSLRGFEVIDQAKAQLEAQCPSTVSCADILAFAARDSSYHLGGHFYFVPSGRRDGVVSNFADVKLPSFRWNANQLAQIFADKGMTVDEMVTLSGAHSIGVAHCTSFKHRLYNFSQTHDVDPTLDPQYAAYLRNRCPPDSAQVQMDLSTPNALDNMYYNNLLRNRGMFASDQALMNNTITRALVHGKARFGRVWAFKFALAMVRLGSIGVLTGTQGQIRTNCNSIN